MKTIFMFNLYSFYTFWLSGINKIIIYFINFVIKE